MSTTRKIETYQPASDAKERWPDWTIVITDLGGIPGVVCPRRKIMLLQGGKVSEEVALARAVAHLDLGSHELVGELTEEQMQRARWLADVRLDREGSRE